MRSQYYEKDNFHNIHIEAKASEFMEVLNNLVNYDDGQGRNYDILDSEIYE